ncbi:MAG: mandelate racemase/muconate lactonizing enzyme family protein [Chloroflexi bacterium]|nr:mandelate racemase/muconate lactonizing enzyme family protein [Chloroflexota bacterium]
MKIGRVQAHIVDLGERNAHIVTIETDTGLVGTGETVLRRRDATVHANLEELGRYLLGKDPLAIEDHSEKLFRDSFWSGGPLHAAARSAVDIALWDIAGQRYDAPLFDMFGGRTRTSIPVYAHAPSGPEPRAFAANVARLKARGFHGAKTGLPLFYGSETSPVGGDYRHGIGPIDPSLPETSFLPVSVIDRIAEWFEAARTEVGPAFELMVDCHGRLNLPTAVRLIDALRPFGLLFIEEPLPPEAVEEYARLTRRSPVPIAAGERLTSMYDVRPFLAKGALSILQCDIVTCGGLTGARKIAAMAEAHYIPLSPHNPNGPIATLAAGHLLSVIPNAYLLETFGSESDIEAFAAIVDHPPLIQEGALILDGERPGLGAAVREEAFRERPAGDYSGTR